METRLVFLVFFVGFHTDYDYNTDRIHTMVYLPTFTITNQPNVGNIAYMDPYGHVTMVKCIKY